VAFSFPSKNIPVRIKVEVNVALYFTFTILIDYNAVVLFAGRWISKETSVVDYGNSRVCFNNRHLNFGLAVEKFRHDVGLIAALWIQVNDCPRLLDATGISDFLR